VGFFSQKKHKKSKAPASNDAVLLFLKETPKIKGFRSKTRGASFLKRNTKNQKLPLKNGSF